MQNFKYAPNLVEFAHIVHAHSARAYETLKDFLPVPSPRTLLLHKSRQPRFPVGIQERTFSLVVERLAELDYDGPIALSCDDTKLLASFHPYYDHDRGGYFLLGHVGEPYQLIDHEAFRDVIHNHQLKKATKLRLWCIQIPIPKIPTIIVSAISIPENLKADDLFTYLWDIISGFLARNIKIASYAADGSNVERSVQRQLEKHASHSITIPIKHPQSGCPDIAVKVSFFIGNQPIAIIQDPKHLLKTFRNNLFSGARILTFPTSTAFFAQVRQIAIAADSPIYIRDVDKADRQDDNAATRLFCGATLEWLISNHPEHLGLVVYLFLCGELVDAYQNRFLTLLERVQIVLRMLFFIDLWEKFLDLSKYPKARHYVSPQCADITRTLIHGFLQVMIIYRDYCGNRRPLFPWLLSTEVVEHVFGICRQIVKDFTMLDFHYMIREAALSSKFSDGKARASGYNHTYTDIRGIDIHALSTYPTNEDINEAAVRAHGEAESLFALLGVAASDLYDSRSVHLPSIRTWLKPQDDDIFNFHDSDNEDDNDNLGDGSDTNPEDDYQHTLDSFEDSNNELTSIQERRVMDHRYATIALSVNQQMEILSLPELDDASLDEALSEDASQISNTLLQCRAPQLVRLRFGHQTKQAASGIRTSKSRTAGNDSAAVTEVLTHRQIVLKGFSDIIRERGEKGIGTGLERAFRWRNPAPGGRGGEINDAATPTVTLGNSANAAAVADAAAKQGGRHSWVSDSSNIMAISNIAVQLFEHHLGPRFRDVPHAQVFHVQRYDLLPPSTFLCSLLHTPESTQQGLKLSSDDWEFFKKVTENSRKVLEAVKTCNGRKSQAADDEE
ncbi:hypothetical protein BD779DRAFT_1612653 [Infundibulicybe gibba]|nr:hypothetical protein BD779DRAFT_1612653 [Infundibulicybe gibba]